MVGSDDNVKTSVVHAYHPTLNVNNIRSLVPLVLDGDKVQYSPWATLFRNTAKVYCVLDHIDPKVTRPTDIDEDLWERLDVVVLQWLFGTVSTPLLYCILDEKAMAMVAWDKLRDLFQYNKITRVVHLENQFGLIELEHCGSLAGYCQQLKTISDQLAAIGHPILEERLVLHLAGKLTPEYAIVATLIQQGSPIPSFSKACSMLELDCVSREKNKRSTYSSSSTALLAACDNNTSSHTHNGGSGVSRPFAGPGKGKGGKKNNYKGKNNGKQQGAPSTQTQQQQPYFPYWPWAPYYPPCPVPSMPGQWRPPYTQQQSPVPHGKQGLLRPAPRPPNAAFLAPGNTYQLTNLPAFFNTLNLQAPDQNWYMDTGATSQLMNGLGSPDGENSEDVQ